MLNREHNAKAFTIKEQHKRKIRLFCSCVIYYDPVIINTKEVVQKDKKYFHIQL